MPARLISLRLLLPSVVLPALIVATDQALLAMMQGYRWSGPMTLVIMGWFVVQTGLLAYVSGRWLPNWGLRLMVISWGLLRINFLFMQTATDIGWIGHLLSLTFLSSQIGALAAWIVLGTSAWWQRLALLCVACWPILFFSKWSRELDSWEISRWEVIVLVQSVGTWVLVAALRVTGHRIEPAPPTPLNGDAGPIQFSIRDLLIATTAVAISVPLVEGMLREWSLTGREWLHASVNGLVLAVVSLAAIWAALGDGCWWKRVLWFAFLTLTAGAGLLGLDEIILHPHERSPLLLHQLTYAGWWWVARTSLTGSFLAAMLLVLRAAGYRLVRRRR